MTLAQLQRLLAVLTSCRVHLYDVSLAVDVEHQIAVVKSLIALRQGGGGGGSRTTPPVPKISRA